MVSRMMKQIVQQVEEVQLLPAGRSSAIVDRLGGTFIDAGERGGKGHNVFSDGTYASCGGYDVLQEPILAPLSSCLLLAISPAGLGEAFKPGCWSTSKGSVLHQGGRGIGHFRLAIMKLDRASSCWPPTRLWRWPENGKPC